MARIRTIKPEFFTSEQLVECSPIARLLFLGLIVFSDDGGRHPASTKRLALEVFPGDKVPAKKVAEWISQLIKAGLVLEYKSPQGQLFWWVTGFEKHQKVDRPTIRFPSPFADGSTIVRGYVGEPSPMESNGMESNGMESNGREPPLPPLDFSLVAFPAGLDTPEVRQAILDWLDYKRARGESYKKPEKQLGCKLREFTAPSQFVAAVASSMGSNYAGLWPAKTGHGTTAVATSIDLPGATS